MTYVNVSKSRNPDRYRERYPECCEWLKPSAFPYIFQHNSSYYNTHRSYNQNLQLKHSNSWISRKQTKFSSCQINLSTNNNKVEFLMAQLGLGPLYPITLAKLCLHLYQTLFCRCFGLFFLKPQARDLVYRNRMFLVN